MDVEIDNLSVEDVICFNILDDALHPFSPSLTLKILHYKWGKK